MNTKTNPVVGDDTDMELRNGHAHFDFVICNKPVIVNGKNRIFADHGFAVCGMTDGLWEVVRVDVEGFYSRKDGTGPTQKKARISYSFMPPVDEGATWHPDYAPPPWLVDFVKAFENRLSGRSTA